MDTKWRNLLVLLVIVVGAYFVYNSLQAPERLAPTELSELQATWQDKGVDVSNLDEQGIENIVSLSDSDLEKIRASLLDQKSSARVGSSKEALLDTHVKLTEFVLVSKQVDEQQAKLEEAGMDNPCGQIAMLKERNSLLKNKFAKLSSYSDSVANLADKHSAVADTAGFEKFDARLDLRRDSLKEAEESLKKLEEACK